jgi:hypothetical protein
MLNGISEEKLLVKRPLGRTKRRLTLREILETGCKDLRLIKLVQDQAVFCICQQSFNYCYYYYSEWTYKDVLAGRYKSADYTLRNTALIYANKFALKHFHIDVKESSFLSTATKFLHVISVIMYNNRVIHVYLNI